MKNSSSKVKILAKFGSLLSLGCLTLLPSIIIVPADNNQIVELASASPIADGDSTEQTSNTNVDNAGTIDGDSTVMTSPPAEAVGESFELPNESGSGMIKYIILTEDTGNKTGTVSASAGTVKPMEVLNIPETVTYGDFTYTLTQLSNLAFQDCVGITSAIIPDGFIYWGSQIFNGCSNLTSLTIGFGSHGLNVYQFTNCPNLNHIDVTGNPNYTMVGGKDQYTGCLVEGTTIASDCSNVIVTTHEVVLPETVDTVGNNAFNSTSNLTTITFPNNLFSIGDSSFAGCTLLNDVVIPDKVTSIGNNAFSNCKNLTNIKIGKNITSLSKNSYGSSNNPFNKCTSLDYIDVTGNPNFTMVGGKDQYTGCLVQGEEIADDCSNVRAATHDVILPDDVLSIRYASFSHFGLINITLPDTVTSIKSGAFGSCENLVNVTIGSGISLIESRGFSDCPNLTNIIIYAPIPPFLENNIFDSISDLKIYVPEDLLETYEKTDVVGWTDEIKALIRALPPEPVIPANNNLAIIIGCSVGGVVLLGAVTACTIIYLKKYKNKR